MRLLPEYEITHLLSSFLLGGMIITCGVEVKNEPFIWCGV